MAIIKGLDSGAVLYSYEFMGEQYVRNEETGRYEKKPMIRHARIELYTRRARTNGAYINAPIHFLIPFLKALGVKLLEHGFDQDKNAPNYIAVGCNIRQITKEQYEQEQIHDIAQSVYEKKIKNEQLHQFIMGQETTDYLKQKIVTMEQQYEKAIPEDAWPIERPAHLPTFSPLVPQPLWTEGTVERIVRMGGIR